MFLEKNIEGYLFKDLLSLIGPPPTKNQQDEGVTYPLVMTAFAGIELMGALLSDDQFNASNGKTYFRNYWTKYLYPSVMDGDKIADYLYQLVRHGIAHVFLLKGPIGIVRRQPAYHLKRDESGLFFVDAVQLANDFIRSYESNVPSMQSASTGKVNNATMTTRLGEIEAVYNDQAAKCPTPNISGTVLTFSVAYSSTTPKVNTYKI